MARVAGGSIPKFNTFGCVQIFLVIGIWESVRALVFMLTGVERPCSSGTWVAEPSLDDALPVAGAVRGPARNSGAGGAGVPADKPNTNSTLAGPPSEASPTAARKPQLLKQGRPEDIQPMIWLHFPACGSNFETTLVHHACGDKIPSNFTVVDAVNPVPSSPKETVRCEYNGREVQLGWANASTCRWNALCGLGKFGRLSSGSDPLWLHPKSAEKWSYPTRLSAFNEMWPHPLEGMPFGLFRGITEGHLSKVVAMFREPRQRVISQFHNIQRHNPKADIRWISKRFSACMAQMLLGCACGRLTLDNSLFYLGFTAEEAQTRAASRVWQLGFVGLADDWALSVCLFHAMFGGNCLPVEFQWLSRGAAITSETYNASAYGLGDNYRPIDDEVYNAAVGVFAARLLRYRVDREVCRLHICPSAAQYFG